MRTRAFALALALALSAAKTGAAQTPPLASEKIAVGDWQLAPTMELRVRGEYRRDAPDLGGTDGFGRLTPRVRDAWVVMERARVGLGAEHGALRAQITLQDARALGSPAPTPGAPPNVAVGNFDFEAMSVLLEAPGPLGTSFADRAGPAQSGVQLHGLLAGWGIDPLLRLEAYGLLRIARSSGAELDGSRFSVARLAGELFTGALRISGDGSGFTYGVEGAYQLGGASSLGIGGSDVRAWAASAHVSKILDQVAWTPTLRVSGSYASGDDGRGTYTQFDPLLPDPQRFHGQMDLFSWSNHLDAAGGVSVVPVTDTSVSLLYRYARLANARGEWIGSYLSSIGVAPPGSSEELGHEIDATFSWRPWAPLELKAGYSALLLGDGARAVMAAQARGRRQADGSIRAETVSHYAYAQATLNVP